MENNTTAPLTYTTARGDAGLLCAWAVQGHGGTFAYGGTFAAWRAAWRAAQIIARACGLTYAEATARIKDTYLAEVCQ